MFKAVDLDNRTVDIKRQSSSYLTYSFDLFDCVLDIRARSVKRNRLESKLLNIVKRLLVTRQHLADYTLDIENEDIKSPACGHF